MLINEDVEIAVREMLKDGKTVNPNTICKHIGIEPYIIIKDEDGKFKKCINNQIKIYSCIDKLRKKHIKWDKRHREAREKYKNGWLKAMKWDSKLHKYIYYKDIMAYEEFIDMREPEEGIFLIPNQDNNYYIPNFEEKRKWIKKHITSGHISIVTRVENAMNCGIVEDNWTTRKNIKNSNPHIYITYKEEEIEPKKTKLKGFW